MDNQHIDERYELYCKMLDELDESCRLIIDYDSVPHNYGSATLYQPNLRSSIRLDTAQESLQRNCRNLQKNSQCLLSINKET